MSLYRKKPVVIEAVQLRWDTWNEMCEHAGVGKLSDGKPEGNNDFLPEIALSIPTLEGVMVGRENDWIIKGVKGELYPCKPDIFEATYEPADATRGGDGGEGYWMMVQALKSIRDLELDRPMLWEGPTAEWQHQQLSLAQTLAAKALAKAERLATTPAVGQGKEAR